MKRIHHVCIQTNNYMESLDFYVKVLGFKIIKETKDFHKRAYNTWLEQDNFMIELQTGKDNEELVKVEKNIQGLTHICFLVDDVIETVRHIKSLGYNKFKLKDGNDIYNVEGSKLSKVVAPEGTIIEIRDIKEI